MGHTANRQLTFFLVVFVLFQAMQMSLAVMENVSRGKNATETYTYRNGTSDKAVDGNYASSDLDQCATLLWPGITRSSYGTVEWQVDLGDLYAIASVTIYNTAVLPEGAFTKEMHVCAIHRRRASCMTIEPSHKNGYSLQPGGNIVVHFNQLVVADTIRISKSGFLTLCEVDVLGTKVVLEPEEDVSVGKAATQSGTINDHIANYAVDGKNNTTDLSMCASALYDYSFDDRRAWWQVNLGDFYLVKAITVYFPTVRPDSVYTYRFKTYISFNDSLPPSHEYSGPGTCYRSSHYVYEFYNGVSYANCTQSGSSYSLTVGRYVTIVPYRYWVSVLTLCEITVVGVRQDISPDDPALDVFKPPSTETTMDTAYIAFVLSIAAAAVAVVFAILCIILLIIVIKLRGRTMNGNSATPAANAYHENIPKKEKQRESQHELQPTAPEPVVYVEDECDDEYEYVDVAEPVPPRKKPPKPLPSKPHSRF